jgi:hypothetical protein
MQLSSNGHVFVNNHFIDYSSTEILVWMKFHGTWVETFNS